MSTHAGTTHRHVGKRASIRDTHAAIILIICRQADRAATDRVESPFFRGRSRRGKYDRRRKTILTAVAHV